MMVTDERIISRFKRAPTWCAGEGVGDVCNPGIITTQERDHILNVFAEVERLRFQAHIVAGVLKEQTETIERLQERAIELSFRAYPAGPSGY